MAGELGAADDEDDVRHEALRVERGDLGQHGRRVVQSGRRRRGRRWHGGRSVAGLHPLHSQLGQMIKCRNFDFVKFPSFLQLQSCSTVQCRLFILSSYDYDFETMDVRKFYQSVGKPRL